MTDITGAAPNSMAAGSNPQSMQSASKLVPVSVGTVAANKELNSRIIEVTLLEQSSMLGGELSDRVTNFETSGSSPDGRSYVNKLKTTVSVQATWLPMHGSNRATPPDVRRGESVIIYQFADVDKYYWATLMDDMKLRKLETVVWAFSNTRKESESSTATTTYFFEVSTHSKLVHLHMSDNDGEACTYDVQFNGKDGYFVLQDGFGNSIRLNSADNQFHIETAEGSFIDLSKGNLHIKLSGTYTLEAAKTVEKTNREQTGNTKVIGEAITTGNQKVGSLSTGAGGGGATAVFEGPVQFNATINSTADITTTGNISGNNL